MLFPLISNNLFFRLVTRIMDVAAFLSKKAAVFEASGQIERNKAPGSGTRVRREKQMENMDKIIMNTQHDRKVREP